MVLRVKNVSKRYLVKKGNYKDYFIKTKSQEIWALKNIDFSVNEGEILGIIGSNGSGKSTLLRILSKITRPTSGEIHIKGKTLSLLEVGTGFHPELTGRENIYLNGSLIGMAKKEINANIDNIIEFSGIKEFVDIPVKKYSSGMYVRLAFSIAAHMDPDILLIDEVLSVGDLDFQKKCIAHMNKITKNKNKTIIMVSHNLDIIQALCHRCIWLHKGSIKQIDKTNIVINNYIDEKRDFLNIPVGKREDRLGNGKIKATKVEMKNEKGENIEFLHSGQNACFYIHYEVIDETVESIEIAFPINSVNLQSRIANIYSKTINKKIEIKGKTGTIMLKINRLPLNIGEYSYNIWLGSNGEIFDNVINAGYFNVLFGDFYNSGFLPPVEHGIILLDYEIN
jgi:lipopolysaccharide transport system ATP-binding protein